jgi:hypothetical protein
MTRQNNTTFKKGHKAGGSRKGAGPKTAAEKAAAVMKRVVSRGSQARVNFSAPARSQAAATQEDEIEHATDKSVVDSGSVQDQESTEEEKNSRVIFLDNLEEALLQNEVAVGVDGGGGDSNPDDDDSTESSINLYEGDEVDETVAKKKLRTRGYVPPKGSVVEKFLDDVKYEVKNGCYTARVKNGMTWIPPSMDTTINGSIVTSVHWKSKCLLSSRNMGLLLSPSYTIPVHRINE